MADEKDLNTSQLVAGADLNKDQLVAGADLTASGQSEPEKLADGTDENKTVKYAELKKATERATAAEAAQKAAEEQAQQLQNQMALVAANQQVQQPAQQTQLPASVYDQAKADLGLANVDFIEEADRGRIYARINEITQAQNQQSAAVFANRQFESSHPDFGSVVGLRNPVNGKVQPTAEILKILTEKPYLTTAAYASSEGAYSIVMQERELAKLQQQNTVAEEHLKQQGIDNKLAPISGAAAAGGAMQAASGSVTAEQQEAMEQRVASGEFNTKG